MGSSPAVPATGPAPVSTSRREDSGREERFLARIQGWFRSLGAWVMRWWWHFRFLFFALFLLLAVVLFWLWVVSLALATIRFLIHAVAVLMAWLGGKGPHGHHGPGIRKELSILMRSLWAERTGHYRELARPVARGYVAVRQVMVEFWRWSPGYKVAAMVATLFLVVIPGLYVVPRPHYVQILDDNVIEHHNAPDGDIRYLIHAADLHQPGKLREYENERALRLGKVDPQGLKNSLVPGRYYRLWVVGVRWWYVPTLFPNIIAAREVDREGNPLEAPSHLIPAATASQP